MRPYGQESRRPAGCHTHGQQCDPAAEVRKDVDANKKAARRRLRDELDWEDWDFYEPPPKSKRSGTIRVRLRKKEAPSP